MLRHPGLAPLSRQHHHGLALCVVTRRALAGGPSSEELSRAAQHIVRAFDVELADHFRLEEQFIFPLLDSPSVGVVEQEHRKLAELVERLRSRPDAGVMDEFVSLLESHIRFEEREWFEELQGSVEEDALKALESALHAGICPADIKQ